VKAYHHPLTFTAEWRLAATKSLKDSLSEKISKFCPPFFPYALCGILPPFVTNYPRDRPTTKRKLF
jgi:hypothetical protein